jgi:hypothetical protein
MKRTYLGLCAAAIVSSVIAAVALASEEATSPEGASAIYGVTIPKGYRQWELIAPAVEADPLNEIRAVLGNPVAIEAYLDGTLPFPDGTVLVKLAWKKVQSPEFESASVPGEVTKSGVQIMVKDSKRYPGTGGWGFGRFINRKPVDEAQHQTCFACHEARAERRDYVFTRYAP